MKDREKEFEDMRKRFDERRGADWDDHRRRMDEMNERRKQKTPEDWEKESEKMRKRF